MGVSRLRVQFVHGLEGSPQGSKARLFVEHFDARIPEMDTRDRASCVEVHRRALEDFRPDVLVGSSFGGAVVVDLLRAGHWHGPTLLLAQAAVYYDPAVELPEGVPVWLVHGSGDTLVDPEHSRRLARTGSPDLVRLIEVEDDHSLHDLTSGGKLVKIVRDLASGASPEEG